jgi:ADP-ribose pyrophosphatase
VPWPEYDSAAQKSYDHTNVVTEYETKGARGWAASPTARTTAENVKSYVDQILVSATGELLNPGGRTGIKDGRGLLGGWGPNFAADPMVFRVNPETSTLEILLIQRKDTGAWAIPGGMSDFGEPISGTLKRELKEETSLALTADRFSVVYAGYVDEPRNTDKAWMETVAAAALLTPEEARTAKIGAGDDARLAKWVTIEPALLTSLYASHGRFVRLALEQLPVLYGEQLIHVAEQIQSVRDPASK